MGNSFLYEIKDYIKQENKLKNINNNMYII